MNGMYVGGNYIVCPRCGSDDVRTEFLTDVKTKHRGLFKWLLWIILALCTCGIAIIIPLITNTKTKTTHRKVCICQKCGNSW